LPGTFLHGKPQLDTKFHRPKHAYRIFNKTSARISYGAYQSLLNILQPAHVIYDIAAKTLVKKAINGKKVLLEITSNPKEDGRIIVDGVVYYFPKVVSRYYEGYVYYVPVTNGKAKRIKNKIIEANLFELNGQVFISNFKVVK
jgi:hypothetical protein